MLTADASPMPAVGLPPAASVAELLLARFDASRDRDAICDALDGGTIWRWDEVVAAAVDVAADLVAAGLGRGDRLAHLGPHGPDWIVVDLACLLSGVVHVPLHADASRAEHAEQLSWLAPRGIVLSGPAGPGRPTWPTTAEVGPPLRIDLRAATGDGRSSAGRCWRNGILRGGGWRWRLDDAETLRAEVARLVEACDPDNCSTILLSSGTSGRPKGVLHSQRAIVANATAAAEVFLDDPRDVRLSWLPMSHALARTGDLVTALVRGGCLNVVTDRRRTLDACRVLPPTVVLGVPAFFERLERAVAAGRVADLAAALGGRVRVCVSGGGPLRERTAAFFAARGVPLVEGYGLAEAGPVVTLSNPRTARPGSVGPPIPGVEVRIDDRPGAVGQLLVRTPSRAVGVIVGDGDAAGSVAGGHDDAWLETGDLAQIDADGHVRITGRLVDTLVLAGGAKVPPATVEAALAEDPAVAQICVVGHGLEAPLAVVVPEPAELRAALRRMGVRVWSRRSAIAHPQVVRWLARRLARRQRSLPRAWRVRRAFLVGRPFDEAHGEATPSLKLKRGPIAAHFAAEIAAAAAERPPRWVAVVPGAAPVRRDPAPPARRPAAPPEAWLPAELWGGPAAFPAESSGFVAAAAAAAAPLSDGVASILEWAVRVVRGLRDEGRLYEPAVHAAGEAAPIDDAPGRPVGKFSRQAEESLGDTGLWGLLVPERFGGAGCSLRDLVRAVTRLAADVPTAAGMLAVHSSIGAVSALTAFGTEEQQRRHLPGLAQGRPLSIFGATEPQAGCDLHAIRSCLERHDGRLVLSGTKVFITGATHGRTVKLLALLDGRPAVVLVRLPVADMPSFRLRHYGLHPLKHAHNAALEFTRFEVDEADVLAPPADAKDGMPIVWHGLNRGRVTLAAQAAGTLRLLLAHAREHAAVRRTWGEPIAARELVRGRLARIAASIAACDALAAWAAAAIDAGQSGELEAIVAKVVASECVRAAAIDSLGIHGGRAFLVGHPLGDSFHDHFAVTVYEGESDLLGLALLKGLCRHHPAAGGPEGWRRAAEWLAWRAGGLARRPARAGREVLDRRLRDHAVAARRQLDAAAVRLDRAVRRLGRSLADRQLLAAAISAEIREAVSVLAVAHHADATGEEEGLAAADCWCRLALARASGGRLTAADHAALAVLGGEVAVGGGVRPTDAS
jgi:long-subunit acyl-CoA synthetase (AMP-forming)/alkylation response protein AidB-like acyl-CoA dehydrogenase